MTQMRNTALSAAGFSAGIIVLLAQGIGTQTYNSLALWASIFSLVAWLYGALYTSAFLAHDENTYRHLNVFIAAATGSLGYAFLFIAVVAIVWQISVAASVVLAALGILLAGSLAKHYQAVAKYCERADA